MTDPVLETDVKLHSDEFVRIYTNIRMLVWMRIMKQLYYSDNLTDCVKYSPNLVLLLCLHLIYINVLIQHFYILIFLKQMHSLFNYLFNNHKCCYVPSFRCWDLISLLCKKFENVIAEKLMHHLVIPLCLYNLGVNI